MPYLSAALSAFNCLCPSPFLFTLERSFMPTCDYVLTDTPDGPLKVRALYRVQGPLGAVVWDVLAANSEDELRDILRHRLAVTNHTTAILSEYGNPFPRTINLTVPLRPRSDWSFLNN